MSIPSSSLSPAPRDAVRLVRRLEPLDAREALVHLLTPRDVAVHLQAKVTGTVVAFRGAAVDTAGMSWSQVADAVADLVVDVAELEDEFLDLNGPVWGLLKPIRSGARTLLSGAELLFGAQCVMLPADAPGEVVAAVAQRVAGGVRLRAGAERVAGWDVTYLADGQAVVVAVTGRA